MPYLMREDNVIVGYATYPIGDVPEYVPDDNEEFQEYLARLSAPKPDS